MKAWIAIPIFFLLIASSLHAQRRNDPLSSTEIDQLRDASLDPEKRLGLYITFARGRLTSMDEARSDPKVKDRGEITHDWLVDFSTIYDELNDNIDAYADRKEDLRKALNKVIEADTEFQAKLRALKDTTSTNAQETHHYDFVLGTAIETLDSSIEDHRQLLKEQEATARKKKKK